MSEHEKPIAAYKILSDEQGTRYRFFCDLSGLAVYTSAAIKETGEHGKLLSVWESEAKQHFNHCKKCGKWVCDAMYNPDVLQCVKCAPWEALPSFCPHCGEALSSEQLYCEKCGTELRYEGAESNDR